MSEVRLKVSVSQIWFLLKSLEYMTSDEGVKRFLAEYPDADQAALAADLESLIEKITGANP